MTDVAIRAQATNAAPRDYTIPGAQEILPKSVRAVMDGTSAAGTWYPCLQILDPGGNVMVSAISTSALAAGASADVSWFPHLTSAAVQVQDNDVAVATVPTLDFEDSASVTWSISDDIPNNRAKISAAAAGGGVVQKDYQQNTANVTIAGVSGGLGTQSTILTGAIVSYAAVRTKIEVYTPRLFCGSGTNVTLSLFDNFAGVYIGDIATIVGTGVTSTDIDVPCYVAVYITPTAGNHQYVIAGYKWGPGPGFNNAVFVGGPGGAGTYVPAYMRVTTGG